MDTNANTPLSLDLVYPGTGQRVRMVGTAEAPEWIAKDVCEVLGLGNVWMALGRLDDDDRGIASTDTIGGESRLPTVNEFGLYSLILSSCGPEARAFRRWIVHEVLPSIRQTGSYVLPPAAPTAALEIPNRVARLRSLELAERVFSLGGKVEERHRLVLQNKVLDFIMEDSDEPQRYQLTIAARAEQRGFHLDIAQAHRIGRLVAVLYRDRHGRAPEQREQSVGGVVRSVATYTAEDLDLIDATIDEVLGLDKLKLAN